MMKHAKQLLEQCRHKFPSTRPHQSHSLTLRDDTLVLTLMLGDTYQEFNLSDADLERPVEDLVKDATRLFKRSKNVPKPPDSVA